MARRQLVTDLRTCKLRLVTLERNTPIASLQAPLARQGALERWRRACADAATAALLTDKVVDFIDSLDAAQASTCLVGAAAQARLALRPAAAGSSSAARSDEAAAASLLKDTLGTLTHACALARALALALAPALARALALALAPALARALALALAPALAPAPALAQSLTLCRQPARVTRPKRAGDSVFARDCPQQNDVLDLLDPDRVISEIRRLPAGRALHHVQVSAGHRGPRPRPSSSPARTPCP